MTGMCMKKIFPQNPTVQAFLSLLIILVTLLVLMVILADDLTDDVIEEIIGGSATEIIGAIITLIVVNVLFNRYNIEQEKKKEREAIIRADRVIDFLLDRYSLYLYLITHDVMTDYMFGDYDDKKNSAKYSLKHEIKPSDLQHMNQTNPLYVDPIISMKKRSIVYFFDNEKELRNMIFSILQTINFNFYKPIADAMLSYVEASTQNDLKECILDHYKPHYKTDKNGKITQQKPLIDDVIEWLKEGGLEKYISGLSENRNTVSGLHHPYYLLYEMIMKEKNALISYKDEVKKLTKGSIKCNKPHLI